MCATTGNFRPFFRIVIIATIVKISLYYFMIILQCVKSVIFLAL